MTKLTNPQKLVILAVTLTMAFLTVRFFSEQSWNAPEGAQKVNIDEVYTLVEARRSNKIDQLVIRRTAETCSEAQAIASFYDSCVEVFEHNANGDCNSLIAPPEGLTIPDNLTEAKRYQDSFFQAAAYTCKSEQPRIILIEPTSNPNAKVGTPR